MNLQPIPFPLALKRGLGRALLHLDTHQDEATFQVVWEALLHSQRYDPQVEGLGTTYLLDLAHRAGVWQDLRPRLIDALGEDDSWDNIQCIMLLGALGEEGDQQAVEHLKQRLVQDLQNEGQQATWLIHALVLAQGDEGLRFALSELGRNSAENILSLREVKSHLEGDQEGTLQMWAAADPFIQQYLEGQRHPPARTSACGVDASYENIQRCLEGSLGQVLHLFRHATPETLQRLAEDLLVEKSPLRLQRLLLFFQRRPFPLGPEPILPLARHEDSDVAWRATVVLEHFEDPRVRTLALDLLQHPETATDGVSLLEKNFQKGDEVLLRRALGALAARGDEDHLCSFMRSLTGVARTQLTPELLDLLAEGFGHQPCSHCRFTLVRLLQEHQRLPSWLLEEARLDLSEDLRELVTQGQ